MLFCSSFYVYFVCSFPLGLWLNSRAFLENYLLACKIRNSSAEEIEKSTPPPPQEIRKMLVEAYYLLRMAGLSYVR